MPNTAGFTSRAIGVLAPNRYSSAGSAKYSTKLFNPAIADSGSMPRAAAT